MQSVVQAHSFLSPSRKTRQLYIDGFISNFLSPSRFGRCPSTRTSPGKHHRTSPAGSGVQKCHFSRFLCVFCREIFARRDQSRSAELICLSVSQTRFSPANNRLDSSVFLLRSTLAAGRVALPIVEGISMSAFVRRTHSSDETVVKPPPIRVNLGERTASESRIDAEQLVNLKFNLAICAKAARFAELRLLRLRRGRCRFEYIQGERAC